MKFKKEDIEKASEDGVISKGDCEKLINHLSNNVKKTGFLEYFLMGMIFVFSLGILVSFFFDSISPIAVIVIFLTLSAGAMYLLIKKAKQETFVSFGIGVVSVLFSTLAIGTLLDSYTGLEEELILSFSSLFALIKALSIRHYTKDERYLSISSFSLILCLLNYLQIISGDESKLILIISLLVLLFSTLILIKDIVSFEGFKSLAFPAFTMLLIGFVGVFHRYSHVNVEVLLFGVSYMFIGTLIKQRYLTIMGTLTSLFVLFEYLDGFYGMLLVYLSFLILSVVLLFNVKRLKQFEEYVFERIAPKKLKEMIEKK